MDPPTRRVIVAAHRFRLLHYIFLIWWMIVHLIMPILVWWKQILVLSHNFCRGFFGQMHIPLRSLKWTDLTSLGILFDGVNIADDSRGMMRQESRRSATREGGSRSTPTIIGNHTRTGFGDFSLLIGWTVNHEETQDLDYVDATLRIGGLFPTSSKQNAIRLYYGCC